MNELFDKLIIRTTFTLSICLVIIIYKYVHGALFPSAREQLFKRFFPSKNSADTIHLFSRLIGFGIIFSEFYFYIENGVILALFDFLVTAFTSLIFYLASIYIIESIVLYNFEYHDTVLEKKNFSYSIISFSIASSLAYIIKNILIVSNNSISILAFLWLFTMVIAGFATKAYSYFSKLPLTRLIIQKNMATAFSFTGFIWGWSLIISSSIHHQTTSIEWYVIHVLLKIILSIIIFPIFKRGIIFVFKIQDDLIQSSSTMNHKDIYAPEIGYGIYEGIIFFTSCLLTSVITGHINFGSLYPQF